MFDKTEVLVLKNYFYHGDHRRRSSTMTTTTGGNSTNDDDDDDDGSVVVDRAYVGDRYLDHEERYEVFVVKSAERPHLLRWPAAPRPPPSSSLENMEEEKMRMIDHHRLDDDDDENDDRCYDEKKLEEEEEGCDSLASSAPSSPPPPLTDGTDLPGWRCRRIAPCMDGCRRFLRSCGRRPAIDRFCDDVENPFDGVLIVGAGSTLYRRESQPPSFVVVASQTRPLSVYDGGVANKDDGDDGHRRCCRWHTAKRELWFDVSPHPDRAVPALGYDEACALVDDPRERRLDGADDGRCDRRGVGRGGEGGKKITFFSREYEMANHPAKILGAAAGWSAMPTYGSEDGDDDGDDGDDDDDGASAAVGWRDVGAKSATFAGGGRNGWTFANLLSRFGDVAFRLSDGHGEMLPLSTYARYVSGPEGLSDDSPLGIYDSEFGDDGASSPTRVLAEEYVVPRCFGPDLFDLADDGDGDGDDDDYDGGESEDAGRPSRTPRRPPYRWILIGPERSGTGMHVDPLWTSAWVTVLQGRKRWLLFPPETPHEFIGMVEGSPQIPSSIWFRDYYDAVTSSSWPEIYRPTEVEQYPGETVYVPAGWPHLVLNLELTVAVTHNYAPEVGPFLGRVWEETTRDEPDFARRWISGLRRNGREDLASRMMTEGVD